MTSRRDDGYISRNHALRQREWHLRRVWFASLAV